ncbi:MAG TPA: UDP-N-acetylmuramoyl-tripeptide--D-alanyl-D-alanine ligase [Candidatus Methylomirabilis sp.]
MDASTDSDFSPAAPTWPEAPGAAHPGPEGAGAAMTALEAARAAGGRLVGGDPHTVLARFSTDTRTLAPGDFFIALRGPRFDAHAFVADALRAGAVGAMVSRAPEGLRPGAVVVRVEDTLRGLGELARAWRERHGGRVVAVTGTNGKTTTKEMLRAVLGAAGVVYASPGNLNNLVGVPLTLLAWPAAISVAVLELGMSALGEIQRLSEIARPDVGVFTTVGEAHLEFLGSVDGVARAKGEMLPFLDRDRLAVINLDDPYVERFRTRAPGRTLTYGLTPRAEVWASDLAPEGLAGTRFTLHHRREAAPAFIAAPGRHNVSNALAAAAVGFAWGLPAEAIAAGLQDARLAPMRMQPVRLASGAKAINDAYNANPPSMERAIETFFAVRNGGRAILVLGDMLELGRHAQEAHRRVGTFAARSGPDLLIAVGPESRALADAALGAGLPADRVVHCHDVGAAREQLRAALAPDAWVLVKASRGMRLEGVLEGL